MKTHIINLILVTMGLYVFICPSLMSENELTSDNKSEDSSPKFLYTPRIQNAPEVRIDGNSRSIDVNSPSLYVLAPEHAGYTIKEKPTLYWYQSKPTNAKFEFSIVGEDPTKPVFTIGYTPAPGSGIQSIRLTEHKVLLKKGIQYSWYVYYHPRLRASYQGHICQWRH